MQEFFATGLCFALDRNPVWEGIRSVPMIDKHITRGWVEERLDVLHPAHVMALVRLTNLTRILKAAAQAG
jgi:hypothetical protein